MLSKVKAVIIHFLAPGLYDTKHEEITFNIVNGRAVVNVESLLKSDALKRQIIAAQKKEQ